MSTSYQKLMYTEAELFRAAGLIGTGTVTVRTLKRLAGIGEERSRGTLTVLCVKVPYRRTSRVTEQPWVLAPDWEARVTRQLYLQGPQKIRGQLVVGNGPRMPAMPVYPSGAPHHFATDWLGRVRYIGPERQADTRWEDEQEDAA